MRSAFAGCDCLGSNSHFENSLGHQPPETAKKDKIAIVFLKKYVTFVSYITLVTCIMY